MSVEQNKLDAGLNHVKEGLERKKKKLKNFQEVSVLQQRVREASQQKTKIYLELGKHVHRMVRDGRIQDEELLQIVRPIAVQDRLIFEALKHIEQLNLQFPNHVKCECGTFLPQDQPFCTACGRKNIQYELSVTQSLMVCNNCETEVAESSVYCPCCGIATKGVTQGGN